ncbi:MAG: type I 3-dehydroquinate dehydratase, partial [Candidatus Weimeria sp.]
LKKIRSAADDTPLLCTIRTDLEGGNFPVKSADYKDTLRRVADSGCADLIDIEYDTLGDDRGFTDEIKNLGVKTVLSHHDFSCTPDTGTMYDYLVSMKDAGADIVKLAVMPEDSSDVLRLLQVTDDFHRNFPEVPLITMSMGSIGTISRLCGATFGSCVTFGADREASAPGQINFEELKEIIRILSEDE